jgi:hypothetical protein
MPQFLTDAWFDEVQRLRDEAGEIPIPEIVKTIVVNITVADHPEGNKDIHMASGDFKRGHAEAAPTKITMPYEVAKALFVDNDPNAGMQAFMSGQIQVEGDMSVMMQMQAAGEPSPEAKALSEKVRAMTEI